MPQKKNSKEKKPLHVNEPQAPYSSDAGNKSISFFSSFEEMEEDNYKWLASLTPEQHLQNAIANIKRIFADDLKKHPHLGTKISFD